MDSYNHFQGKAPPYTPMVYTPLQQQRHIIWRPGFFRRAPWGALTALLLAIVCAFASAIIIFISHEHAATWKWQPSVLLGFLASFSAAMLLAAFISGVRITWWRAALHGATLAQLHHIWNHGGGGGVISLLSAWRHANKVALASILTTLAGLAYSPLLQRASHFGSMNVYSNLTMSLPGITILPDNYFGNINFGPNGTTTTLRLPFTAVIQDYFNGFEPQTSTYFCNGTCTGGMYAPGISSSCSSASTYVNLRAAGNTGVTGFSISAKRYNDANSIPTLELKSEHIDLTDSSCGAVLVTTTCLIHSGTVYYPVEIQNKTVRRDKSRNITDFVLHPNAGDAATTGRKVAAGPLTALRWIISEYYSCTDVITYDSSSKYMTDTPNGIMALQWQDYSYDGPDSSCSWRWLNPTNVILEALENILFAASMYAANGSSEVFNAVQATNTVVYISSYKYLTIGSGILIVAIIAVFSTLWGWWELGRDITLSPLETARAFGAHLFQYGNDMDANALASGTAGRKFRYGQRVELQNDGIEREVLQFAEIGVGNDPIYPGHKRGACC